MRIRKAVITAAGRGIRLYPAADTVQKHMLPLLDRDGVAKPVLQIIAEEALDSGVEEICVICAPGDEAHYRSQLGSLRDNLLNAYKGVQWAEMQGQRVTELLRTLQFMPQANPMGYGHAVYCAKEFVGSEPFLLLLGDHLYVSAQSDKRCAADLIRLASEEQCPVAAVNPTRESQIGLYGTLTGKRLGGKPGVYQIEKILEKPSLSVAELELTTPGLRAGHYLCFFGMHVLTPAIFDHLEELQPRAGSPHADMQLTPALQSLARSQRYLALEVKGARHDIGARLGILKAQLALGLAGKDKDEILTTLVETMAEYQRMCMSHSRQTPQ